MKKTINFYDFEEAFRKADRYSNFGRAGLKALFNYLEELEAKNKKEIELDVIALCCNYCMYYDFKEIQQDYAVETMDELEEITTVLKVVNGHFIVEN